MNDFEGLLATDYGFKPSGKSAPMSASAAASSKGSTTNHNPNFDLESRGPPRSARSSNSFGGSPSDDRDSVFGSSGSQKPHDFSDLGDIFGGSARYVSKSETRGADSAFDFDSMFGDTGGGGGGGGAKSSSSNSEPVYDKPVYDDDIFDGVPGLKSSSRVKYEDVFASSGASSSPKGSSSAFDELLGGFGKAEPRSKSFGSKGSEKIDKGVPSFDDLIPGFGGSSPPTERSASETWSPETTASVSKTTSKVMEDPFVVPGKFNDPLEEISKLSNSGSTKSDNGRVFDDVDPFDGLGKSVPAFSSDRSKEKDRSASRSDSIGSGTRTYSGRESTEKSSVRSPDSQYQKKTPVDNDWDSQKTMFDMPTASTYSHKSSGQPMSPPSYANSSVKDETTQMDGSSRFEESSDSPEDIWLTVSEIRLYTQPTSAPPPSRPPPPRPVQVSKARTSSPASTNARRKANEYSSYPNSTQNFQVPRSVPAAKGSAASPIDELEDFATSRSQSNADEHGNGLFGEELEMNSVAAAMKEAMDKAEAKFRHAKEVRERESSKAARSREPQPEKDEKAVHERLERERLQREREEEEMEQLRLREIEREQEEKEREQRRLEKERERAREIEREREKARQAVERATREARERAAAEARARVERAKAERAAVERANAEARERAERAAVQRAQAEARERAAVEAKERAEKAAAEARERANSEAKEREARDRAAEARARAERSAVERAAAEARERAAAAAAARANQPKNENDLEAFFSMGRASSAPRPRSNSSDPFDTQFQSRKEPEVAKTYGGTSSNMRKASSTTNIVDDLSSIFGAAPSSGEFQDVEGETEERRRARLERHQRTQERAAKALAEKNERDLQIQRDQAERHRIAETLDVEIKRWAAGKEGNLRALLSTLQYVLWPECGWSPVSLTDMITAASVKKVYRRATLCIHPDKVQQKGANLQQKYIAEKVFDLLKEAWNKFNSEELF